MELNLPELNINELSDSSLIIYADRDVEFIHNSLALHSTTRITPSHRLPKSTNLKPFTHCVNKGKENELECFVVSPSNKDYPEYIISKDTLPYGYKE